MKPILDASGRLETSVITYFPTGTGVLLLRGNDDNLEIKLVRVDESGRLVSIGGKAIEFDKAPAAGKLVDGKFVAAENDDHGPVRSERVADVLQCSRQGDQRDFALFAWIRWLWGFSSNLCGKLRAHPAKAELSPSSVNPGGFK